jgi:hypothetical protein
MGKRVRLERIHSTGFWFDPALRFSSNRNFLDHVHVYIL